MGSEINPTVNLCLVNKSDARKLSVPPSLGNVTSDGVRLKENITIGSLQNRALAKGGEGSSGFIKVGNIDLDSVVLGGDQRLKGTKVAGYEKRKKNR